MKIIFLRHGESYDDIYKEFGGWSYRPPTLKGMQLAHEMAKKLQKQKIEMIFTSPLPRARLFAKELGGKMQCPVQNLMYLKERNTYGLLNGLSLKTAKLQYPELVEKYDKQQYITGSERYEDFIERLQLCTTYLSNLRYKRVLCVTHGYFITTLLEEFLNKIRNTIGYGAYIVCDLTREHLKLLDYSNITFIENRKKETGRMKKFRIIKKSSNAV